MSTKVYEIRLRKVEKDLEKAFSERNFTRVKVLREQAENLRNILDRFVVCK